MLNCLRTQSRVRASFARLRWCKKAVAVMNELSHEQNWFDEVDKSKEELDDKGGNSRGVLANSVVQS